MTLGKRSRTDSAKSTIEREASPQEGTPSNMRAQNDHPFEDNGSPGRTEGQVDTPTNEVNDRHDSVEDAGGGLNSQQQDAGPNLNSNTSGEDLFVPPQNDGDDPRNPDADVESGLDSRQPSPPPNPDRSTPGEDPDGPPPDEGDDPLDQDASAEDGLEGSNATRQDVQPDDLPGGPNDWNPDYIIPHMDALRKSVEFIDNLRAATLENDPIPFDVRERLKSPISEPLHIDNVLRYCLDVYLATTGTNGSETSYDDVCKALKRLSPGVSTLLSHDQLKRKIAELTGVVPMMTDMCSNSCVAFAGPYADLRTCPECSADRYEIITRRKRQISVPCRQALTIPIGPQIQAQYRSPESAWNMGHRARVMEPLLAKLRSGGSIDVYEDVYCSSTILEAAKRGDLTSDDTLLMLCIDGAQLFESKPSDCWIYIWVLLDLAPDLRYKTRYVLPGGFIPGPNKPKNLDSFLYTGLHHLRALQTDGLRIWDSQQGRTFTSHPFFFLGTADGPGLAAIHGQVGHHGALGCREYCGLRGRHKPGGPHYYPALLKPMNYTLPGCDHGDVDIYHLPKASSRQYDENIQRLLRCETNTQFRLTRKNSGLCKPSLFLGLDPKHSSGLPGCLAIDHMHVIAINLPDLLISLWRGTIDCDRDDCRLLWDWVVLTGDVWKLHGTDVARCRPYFPGSFDCTPRNPAEKISSGYKAWEFLLYVFGLCPALLCDLLPHAYWSNFCKLVTGVRLVQQRAVSVPQLVESHRLLLAFTEEYEALYYQRKVERLHFCRQSIHALSHLPSDTIRLGPGVYSSQWTLERTIGNLGEELRQPSKPYANLANRGLRRSQVSALKSMLPDLGPDAHILPRGAVDLGSGYVLLRARDETKVVLRGKQADALRAFMNSESQQTGWRIPDNWEPKYIRWARLRLPNLQIARCVWKETERAFTAERVRRSRNVKVS